MFSFRFRFLLVWKGLLYYSSADIADHWIVHLLGVVSRQVSMESALVSHDAMREIYALVEEPRKSHFRSRNS